MTPAEVIKGAGSDGVILTLSDTGTIKAEGADEARSRWRDLIREHKAGIVDLLRGGEDVPAPVDTVTARWWRLRYTDKRDIEVFDHVPATRAATLAKYPDATAAEPLDGTEWTFTKAAAGDWPELPEPGPDAHRTWLVRFPNRRPVQVTFVPGATRAEVMRRYSQASGAEPVTEEGQPPGEPMNDAERAAVRAWLVSIGETDQSTIADVLERCERDQGALDYFTRRAGEHEAREERAGILEFDAGAHRIDAEAATGCPPIPDQPAASLPRYTGDDERRTCGQCLNLQGRVCTVARPGGLVSARVGYTPSPTLPLRCAGYSPGPDDHDQRPAAERWPLWSLT